MANGILTAECVYVYRASVNAETRRASIYILLSTSRRSFCRTENRT